MDRFLNTASCEDRRRPAIPTMAQRWGCDGGDAEPGGCWLRRLIGRVIYGPADLAACRPDEILEVRKHPREKSR
jgi:hypothetical protein